MGLGKLFRCAWVATFCGPTPFLEAAGLRWTDLLNMPPGAPNLDFRNFLRVAPVSVSHLSRPDPLQVGRSHQPGAGQSHFQSLADTSNRGGVNGVPAEGLFEVGHSQALQRGRPRLSLPPVGIRKVRPELIQLSLRVIGHASDRRISANSSSAHPVGQHFELGELSNLLLGVLSGSCVDPTANILHTTIGVAKLPLLATARLPLRPITEV